MMIELVILWAMWELEGDISGLPVEVPLKLIIIVGVELGNVCDVTH